MFQRILVPLDGSEVSRQSLPAATALAKQNGATLILAQVIHVSYGALPEAYMATPDLYNQLHDQAVADAEANLKTVADEVAAQGIPSETVVLEGDPASELVAYEESGNIDLVVMTTHGRTGLARLVYGSTAEGILRHGSKPVLVIRVAE